MKRVIALILLLIITFSLCACGSAFDDLISTEREIVDAIVLSTPINSRWDWKYIKVGYEGTISQWENSELHDYYKNRLGDTIPAYLITYTYASGTVKTELLFNEDLWNKEES